MNPYDGTPVVRFYGLYKGFVRKNDDPHRRGRIRCYCPQVMGDQSDNPDGWLGWAEPNLSFLGSLEVVDFGSPPTRDEMGYEVGVWLMFEAGNVDFPVYLGGCVVAPTPTSETAQVPIDSVVSTPGGSLLGSLSSAGAGSSKTGDIAPTKPTVGDKETRIVGKKGRNIVIMVQGGGAIVLGPSGVDCEGVFVRANGKVIEASLDDIVG